MSRTTSFCAAVVFLFMSSYRACTTAAHMPWGHCHYAWHASLRSNTHHGFHETSAHFVPQSAAAKAPHLHVGVAVLQGGQAALGIGLGLEGLLAARLRHLQRPLQLLQTKHMAVSIWQLSLMPVSSARELN